MQHKSCLDCKHARRVETYAVTQLECTRGGQANPPFTTGDAQMLIHDPTFYCSEFSARGLQTSLPPAQESEISVIDECFEMTKGVKKVQ